MFFKRFILKIRIFFHNTLWRKRLEDHSVLTRSVFHALRIAAITLHGLKHNRIAGQAAALSYSTLMALGPLIAVAVMASGYLLQDKEDHFISEGLQKVIGFVAAPVAISVDADGDSDSDEHNLNPKLVATIDHIIESTRSNTVGAVGALILIVISILLIVTIENSLNIIWGIEHGRKFGHRVMLYWMWITLGTILATVMTAIISVSILSQMIDNIPWISGTVRTVLNTGAPFVTFALGSLLLAIFYHYLPNTHVQWKPALAGAVLAVLLLYANKELSFLYVDKVVREQSLYGSIGIIPIFMFGMYVFWLIVLIGGQFSYAIQSAHLVSGLRAWQNVSYHTQESIALAALIVASRRFKACEQAATREELAGALGVPINVLNRYLQKLCEINLLSPVEDEDENEARRTRYQPARPLASITFGEFKECYERIGNDEGIQTIKNADPVISKYQNWLTKLYASDQQHEHSNLEELFREQPLGEK